jgi:hypothetical protein
MVRDPGPRAEVQKKQALPFVPFPLQMGSPWRGPLRPAHAAVFVAREECLSLSPDAPSL